MKKCRNDTMSSVTYTNLQRKTSCSYCITDGIGKITWLLSTLVICKDQQLQILPGEANL